jgi:hypothetical protein
MHEQGDQPTDWPPGTRRGRQPSRRPGGGLKKRRCLAGAVAIVVAASAIGAAAGTGLDIEERRG